MHSDPDVTPDAELAARLREGDAAACSAIFRRYFLPVVRFVTRYVASADVAEDVAQELFLRLWQGRATIDPTRSLKAYLFTSARHRALDLMAHDETARHHADDTTHALGADLERSPDPGPDDVAAAHDLLRIAESRVASLSPRLREVYRLSRHDGLRAAEIAEVLGTSVFTVYTQLTKITQALYPILRVWMDD